MSKLYLVPTPIGNLGDITLRALEVLKDVDLVLAEDTRKSSFLLKHFQINKALHSHHKFNEHRSIESLVQRLKGGTSIALITDADGLSADMLCWLNGFVSRPIELIHRLPEVRNSG